jgi:hypothetical protein
MIDDVTLLGVCVVEDELAVRLIREVLMTTICNYVFASTMSMNSKSRKTFVKGRLLSYWKQDHHSVLQYILCTF